MANQLLGINGKKLSDPNKGPAPFKVFLYHDSFEPKIFESQEAVDNALKQGWVDTPAKLKPKAESELKPEIRDHQNESVLQKKINTLQDDIIKASAAVAELTQKLAAAEHTIADLKKANADLEKQLAEAKKGKK